VGDVPFGDGLRFVSVFLYRGHARTSSDSEYVAESPALLDLGGPAVHAHFAGSGDKEYSHYLFA
jgi:hypothetical protein